jgi:uncharacterized circularly permuted ATP-grasp superfamily protein
MATIFNTVIINNVYINIHNNTITGGTNNFVGMVINNYGTPANSDIFFDEVPSIVVERNYPDLEASLKQRLLANQQELEELKGNLGDAVSE